MATGPPERPDHLAGSMRDSAFEPLVLPPAFWQRSDVYLALDRQDIGQLFRLIHHHTGASQTQIGTATVLGQNRVSLIMKDRQEVTTQAVRTRIADRLDMPDHARITLGVGPRQPAAPPGQDDELRQRITSARYIDATAIGILQHHTDSIRLQDRQLGAPAVAAKLETHIAQLSRGLRLTLSPERREQIAAVLADAAALAGWQAIDMGRLTAAWDYFETAVAAAREAGDYPLLAFAAGEQAYVLLELGQPDSALDKVRAVHDSIRGHIPSQTATWLYAAEAEMAAADGQDTACRTALDHADREASHPGTREGLPYLSLEPAHLTRWRGNCLIQLGDTTTIEDLSTALAGMDGTFTRAEAGLRCDLATALHATGERAEARTQLAKATELARITGSARQRRRTRDLARRIGVTA